MSTHIRWFDREFPCDVPAWMFPNIVERLRGTPARLEEIQIGVPSNVLVHRAENTWSIQENAGHLLDLEMLFMTRVRDLKAGKPEMAAADLQNRLTWERNHNEAASADILHTFRLQRGTLVHELENLDESHIELSARHPRLGKVMRLIDLVYFVAEHDDHHLARITHLKHLFLRM